MAISIENRAGLRRASRRRWAARLNTAAALLLAAAVAGMLHYLGARHYRRWDWSRAQFYRLSEKTRALLASLERDVEVVVLFQPGQAAYPEVDRLLREYRYASPRIRVARVDPDRDLARTRELAAQYPLTESNVLLFLCEGRSCVVRAADLHVELPADAAVAGRPPRRAFRGEQLFSSAIRSVTQPTRPVVYFLAGHGEKPIESFDRGTGLAALARLVRQDNLEVRPLQLGEEKGVPADCGALVIAGPRLRFAQPELDLLDAYLERNGRALVLLDSRTTTGLESVLEKWGLRVGDDQVVDPSRTLTGRELFVTRYGQHPVTERLAGVTCVFYLPRSVEAALVPPAGAPGRADRPQAVPLALTSPSGWAESDAEERPMRFDPDRDRGGPVAVGAAVERGPLPDLDVQIRPTRLVVFGDSQFVSNGAMVSGNGDLFMSALNWLLSLEERMAIAPRAVEEARLNLTASQLRAVAALVVGGVPGAVALAGLLVAWRRRT